MSSRVVVLTGGSSGIGRAAAQAFAARGDRVVLAARGRDDLEAVAAQCRALGAEVLVQPTDVTRDEDLAALVAAAQDRFGAVDVWVDTAAVMAYGRFEDVPAEVFNRVVTTDLLGTAAVARAALGAFRRTGAGVLVLTGSLLGEVAVPYMSAYVTAKWGLRGLVRTLRLETRDAPDIHVCVVAPGSVDTPIYTSAGNYAGHVGRPPPPVDSAQRVAAAIVRLADRPRAHRSVGLANEVIRFGFVATPALYDLLVGPLMSRLALSRQPVDAGPGNVFAHRPRTDGGPGRWGRTVVGAAAAGVLATAGATWLRRRG